MTEKALAPHMLGSVSIPYRQMVTQGNGSYAFPMGPCHRVPAPETTEIIPSHQPRSCPGVPSALLSYVPQGTLARALELTAR